MNNPPLTIRKISFTYALMNLVNPFLGGFPVCHGSGGMVGHYAFGARTGGSVVIYGGLFLVLGLFFSQGFAEVAHVLAEHEVSESLPRPGAAGPCRGTRLLGNVTTVMDALIIYRAENRKSRDPR